MTKFERARRQTVLRWRYIITDLSVCNCGFCDYYREYNRDRFFCKNCPMCKIEGCRCVRTDWYKQWEKSLRKYIRNGDEDDFFPLTMAILCYLHTMTDPDKE